MSKQIYLIKYFDEMPDTIFAATTDNNQSYLQINFPSHTVDCQDPHSGQITDILFIILGG